MGKHLWRKHSYGRVEEDHPGCIWTVFRVLNYHPWHNVRKMLPYKKHKSDENSTKSNKDIKAEKEHEISIPQELEEDSIIKYSDSVNSNGSSKNGSKRKRSIKARIRALIKERDDTSTKLDFQEAKGENVDNSAPILMSLLKANPKLIRSISRLDDSSITIKSGLSIKHKEDPKHKDDYVDVLDLFEVDQDLFLKFLQKSPPKKPRLVKSGTFPSRNPSNISTTPRKVEHKHNEIWPMSSNVHELRKAKSQSTIGRSFSLTESLEKYSYLFDTTSNKAIKKHLSKSLRSINEKEFALFDDLNGGKSFNKRLDSFTSSHGESRIEQSDEDKQQIDAMTVVGSNCETADGFTSISVQECENELADCAILEESILVSNFKSKSLRKCSQDSNDLFLVEHQYNQDLEYVTYVLDIAGFSTVENQLESWHNRNQPLDPAMFDGIEVCCPFEPKSTNHIESNFDMSSYRRKILFDLINEALVEIHEKSYAYYPKALSIWCHVRPKTKSKVRVVEQVWEVINEYLSWMAELDPSMDLAVAHDLSKDKNGWVNLQMESEDLSLELEELIFNELLDELACY
ncbi:unnamed protein product [Amaranthus hypochondriacus]